MKKVLLLLIFSQLIGCSTYIVREVRPEVQLPTGLQGCRFYKIKTSDGEQQLTRCPLSSTTLQTLDIKVRTTTTIETQ